MRRTAVVAGIALLLGFLALFVREFAAAFGLQFSFVTLLGVLALVQALRFVQSGRQAERRATETGDPEQRYEAPTPGGDVDDSIAGASRWSRYGRTAQERLRERLRQAAVAVVASRDGCSETEAADRVDGGEWTDDPVAVWFLGEEVALPPQERARLLLTRGSRFQTAFARTVAAIEALEYGAAEDDG